MAIGRIIQNYFDAVRTTWPRAWDDFGQGVMLNKTNGFRALMSIFGRVYTQITAPGQMVPVSRFAELFRQSTLKDADFNIERYRPGTSGEAKLRTDLLEQIFSG